MPKKGTTGSVARTCERCDTAFTTWPSSIKNSGAKFCSMACYHEQRTGVDGLKTCASCDQMLPRASFGLRSDTPSGLASMCRECARTAGRIRYHANLERSRLRCIEKQRRRKEAVRDYARRYGEQNRTRKQANLRRWRSESPMKVRLHRERRRSLKTNAAGYFSANALQGRCEYYGWACYICRIPLTVGSLTIDHRIPLCRGGSNWPANLAPCCRSCNSRKATLTEREYRVRLASAAH